MRLNALCGTFLVVTALESPSTDAFSRTSRFMVCSNHQRRLPQRDADLDGVREGRRVGALLGARLDGIQEPDEIAEYDLKA